MSSSDPSATRTARRLGLGEEDLEAVRLATQAAERKSGGELVCVIVDRCDPYEAEPFKGAALGAVLGSAGAAAWLSWAAAWGEGSPLFAFGWTAIGAAAGFLLVAGIPALKRLLVPDEVLGKHVEHRAAQAFLDEELFATRDRTGVLIFIAAFERRVRILADRGIDERVPEGSWATIARQLTEGLRRLEAAPALVAAVEACGDLLERAGVERRPDDTDELPDEPRLFDE